MVRSLVPWRVRFPRPLVRLEEEMERMMEPLFREENGWWTKGFTPTTNVAETENEFEVTIDLPGMKAEEINIELKEGNLLISGEKKEEKEEKGKTYHRIERYYGEFCRLIPLTSPVKEEKVSAEYKEGVLKVTLPKTEEVKPRHIAVKP